MQGLALFVVTTGARAAIAQDTRLWADVSCSASHIKAPAGLRCRATQVYSGGQGGEATGSGMFQRWTSYGTLRGAKYYYAMAEGVGPGSCIVETDTLVQSVRHKSPEAKAGRGFAKPQHISNVDYVGFGSGKSGDCFGLRMYGPVSGVGYKWILIATFCGPAGSEVGEADIATFASKTGHTD